MLEIIIIILLCRKIWEVADDRGVSPIMYVCLLIAFWFGGEIVGAIIGAIVAVAILHANDNLSVIMISWVGALCGAACGAMLAFVLVSVHPVPDQPSLMDLEQQALRKALRPKRCKRRRRPTAGNAEVVADFEVVEDDQPEVIQDFEVVDEKPCPKPPRPVPLDDDLERRASER